MNTGDVTVFHNSRHPLDTPKFWNSLFLTLFTVSRVQRPPYSGYIEDFGTITMQENTLENSASLSLIRNFWRWFSAHENDIFEMEDNNVELFSQMIARMNFFDEAIDFILGNIKETGKRDLIITSYGNQLALPSLHAFVKAAPELIRFNIIKLIPRTSIDFIKNGITIFKPEDVHFTLDYINGKIDINLLFYNSLKIGEPLHEYSTLSMVLTIIGEQDFISHVRNITAKNATKKELISSDSIMNMSEAFDYLVKNKIHH